MAAELQPDARPGFVDVPLLRWPDEAERAADLEHEGLPFVLLVSSVEKPPASGYRFMDWVRSPVDAQELVARLTNLQARYVLSANGLRPRFDADTGRLTFGNAITTATASQVDAFAVMVARYREIVPADQLRAALRLEECGNDNLLSSRLMRLRRTARAVGLDITRIRDLGFALEPPGRQMTVR